jgi:hypothetical protein
LTLSDIFSYPALRSSCDPSVLANHLELGWAGRIRTFECQVQSLVPYQLGDRPAHLDSKAQRPRISPSHFRETLKLTTGETPFGRSAGKSSNNLFGPNRRDPAPHHVAASLPVHFDFSSLRAGIAMLLMRFFAVNAQLGAAYAQPTTFSLILGAGVTLPKEA